MITRKCWVLLSVTSTTINYLFKFKSFQVNVRDVPDNVFPDTG